MGLLDALNGLTEKMNGLADSVTAKQPDFMSQDGGVTQGAVAPSGAQGLAGLGNINTDNANGQLESPYAQVQKFDTDSRKLVVDTTRFGTAEEYCDYLNKWLSETGLGSVNNVGGKYIAFTVQSNVNNQIVASIMNIYPVLNGVEANSLIQYIQQQPVDPSAKRVIIGYINYSAEQINVAKQLNIELVGANEIIEINNAIDLGTRRLPYVAFDKSSFTHMIAAALNKRYSDNTMGNGVQSTFTQITDNLGAGMQRIGNSLEAGINGVQQAPQQIPQIAPQQAPQIAIGEAVAGPMIAGAGSQMVEGSEPLNQENTTQVQSDVPVMQNEVTNGIVENTIENEGVHVSLEKRD